NRVRTASVQVKKMNSELMKQFNAASVLQVIRRRGPLSRVDIAHEIGLSRPSVSTIVTDLIDAGWVQELGGAEAAAMSEPNPGRGRPKIPVAVREDGHFAIGVEIGAWRATTVVCNLSADIVASRSWSIDGSLAPDVVLDQVCDAIGACISDSGIERSTVLGIGVAMHGIVEPVQGISVYAPNLGWHDVPVVETIEARTGLPTLIENDCNSSALGESLFGAARDKANFVELVVDYGIGSGLYLDGRVYRGVHNTEGQIGHVVVDEDGTRCACGKYGCLEAMASEPAIVRQVKRGLRLGEASCLHEQLRGEIAELTIDQVYQAALSGDRLAQGAISRAARYIGLGAVLYANILNPETIILAGGLAAVSELVVPVVRDMLQMRALGAAAKETRVEVSHLGGSVYPVGAASLVLRRVFDGTILTDQVAL
ncbi:MAG: ROK family transcriptional regulator, partial [Firmicutes bacterium]|nr:ROK family transcriptional regulator [Bacillota bacterium]